MGTVKLRFFLIQCYIRSESWPELYKDDTARWTNFDLSLSIPKTATPAYLFRAFTSLRGCLGRRTRMDGALSDERIQKAVETLQGFHCDALGFGGASARCFAYNEEWEKWDIRQRYPTAEILIMRSE